MSRDEERVGNKILGISIEEATRHEHSPDDSLSGRKKLKKALIVILIVLGISLIMAALNHTI
jgi:hypothetical protein